MFFYKLIQGFKRCNTTLVQTQINIGQRLIFAGKLLSNVRHRYIVD